MIKPDKQIFFKTIELRKALWFFVCLVLFSSVLFLFSPNIFQSQEEGVASAEEMAPGENLQDLSNKIKNFQEEIRFYREKIQEDKEKAETLENEINILDSEIKRIDLEIAKTDLLVKEVELSISEVEKELEAVQQEVKSQKLILGRLLKETYELGEEGLVEILLKNDKFSDFFNDLNAFENIEKNLERTLVQINDLETDIIEKRSAEEFKKARVVQLKAIQMLQGAVFKEREKQKEELVEETRGSEYLFQRLLAKAREEVQSVREKLYTLEGWGVSISLKEALEYAELASSKIEIRPAYLLALLKVESSWGANTGTGDWVNDMHPRDWKAFFEITEKLGMDPDTTPVSRKPEYGWGGAMGIAQFLPSIWLLYEEEIEELTGHDPPSPWDIVDAFIGAALKLSRAGGDTQVYEDEWKAAMIYFAGGSWEDPDFSFYADTVMDLAEFLEEDIEIIKEED